MSASYTTNLRLTLQGTGDNPNTWGDVENTQVINLIEAAITGVTQVDCTGSADINIASTTQNGAPDTARNSVLQLTGTLGANISLIVPAVEKVYIIDGKWVGGYTITVKTSGGAGGVAITTGQKVLLYTNVNTTTQVAISGEGILLSANNLSDVQDPTTSRTNLGLGSMAVQQSSNVSITGGSITGVSGISAVTSVAGRTGVVVLANTDISGLGTAAVKNTGTTSGLIPTLNSNNLPSPIQAWCQATRVGTTWTINAGANIASITYTSTGLYTVAFSNDMSDANYAVLVVSNNITDTISASSATAHSFVVNSVSNAATRNDATTLYIQVLR